MGTLEEVQQLAGASRQLNAIPASIARISPANIRAEVSQQVQNARASLFASAKELGLPDLPDLSWSGAPAPDLANGEAMMEAMRTQVIAGVDPSIPDPALQDVKGKDWKAFGTYPNSKPQDDKFTPEVETAFRDWAMASSIHIDLVEYDQKILPERSKEIEESQAETKRKTEEQKRKFGGLESWLNESMRGDSLDYEQ